MQARIGFVASVVAGCIAFVCAFALRPRTLEPRPTTPVEAVAAEQHAADWALRRALYLPADIAVNRSLPKPGESTAWLTSELEAMRYRDAELVRRLEKAAVLTGLGIIAFWFGVAGLLRAKRAARTLGPRAFGKGIAACVLCTAAGLWLPCIPVEGPSGMIWSAPLLAVGVVAMLVATLVRPAAMHAAAWSGSQL